MISVASAIAWCALCCGITALFTALWWHAAHEATKRAHARTFEALMHERAAHAETRRAHEACLRDCQRKGINGAQRGRHLRSVGSPR